MLPMTGPRLQSPLRTISVLLVHFLLAHFCRGQSQLMGSPQQVVATVGDDIILPCHLKLAVDVTVKTLEWTRPDLNPRFVYVWRAGQELVNVKNPAYKGRTSLFAGELKHGNISLKLSKIKPSDEGKYRCYIPDLTIDSFIELVVASGAVSPPVITLSGIERNRGGVVLQCESKGWYPEPEVVWLDGEGNLLSAGPTETVRGPDDLYTVSSRVTVEKRHSNNFTCRVQQKKTNQIRETHICISDDLFEVQCSSFILTVGLAVSLAVCILLILLLVFFVWKWKQNIIINKRSRRGDSDKGEERNCSKRNQTEDQKETLMAAETVQMEVLNEGKGKKKNSNKTEQQLQEEQQRRKEAENRVKRVLTLFSKELETRKNEVKLKQSELQQLYEEKQKIQNNLQTVKEDLENKNKELETIQATLAQSSQWTLSGRKKEEQKKKNKAEQEAATLKKKLETHQKELDTKIKEVEDKQAEVQKLQDDIQRMETNLRTLMEDLESNNKELERSQAAPVRSSSSGYQWPLISRQRFQDEQQRREKAENKIQILEEKLQKEQQRRKEAEEQIQTKDKELKDKTDEYDQKLRQEQQRAERAERDLEELKIRNTEWENHFREEKTRREKAENNTSSASQSSTTGPNVEVDPRGKYIRLRNWSSEEQQLGGWRLQVQLNETESIMYTFENSFKLQAGQKVTLWVPGCGTHYPPTDLLWRDLKSWRSGDKLQVALISNTGEYHHNSVFNII